MRQRFESLQKIWKSDYFKTAIAVVLIVVVFVGSVLAIAAVLHTPYPALTVESSSMSIPFNQEPPYNFNYFLLTLAHPFDRTLNVGDIIIVQGINPKNLKTSYPNSDIIVFHDPDDYNMLIVHRIVSVENVNGTLYFKTKGDGNGYPDVWPQAPTQGFDPWDYNNPPGVPQNLVVGKVVMRIPWFGWITLFLRDNPWGLPVIIAIILLLVIVEFVLPMLREKKPNEQNVKPCTVTSDTG